jgi:hypothetical protein
MKIYEQKFESNHFLFFHDLWEYVQRKLDTEDGAALFVHPLSEAQHPSASSRDPKQSYLEMKMANEIDAISDLSSGLEKLIEDEFTPPEVKKQA